MVKTDLGETVRRIGEARGEPDWLRALRDRAREFYASAPPPDRTVRLWRYTPPEAFAPRAGPGPDAAADGPEPAPPPWDGAADAAAAVLRGDRLRRVDLGREAAQAGLVLDDLHAAAARHPDRVRPHLGSAAGAESGLFEAFNAARWDGGLFLYVPRGVQIGAPVHLVRDAGASGGAALRLLIVAEDGAAVTVVDDVTGGAGAPGAAPSTGVVETVVGADAAVRYVSLLRPDPAAAVHWTQRARLGRDARFLLVQATVGGATVKADLGAVLDGRGAESRMVGLVIGEGGQHLDHHTVHDHRAPETRSDLHVRVVLRGRGRSVYTGLIRVGRDAVRADAYQENRNLLLDPETRVDSIPELEILTNDVRCTHGATMGPVDPDQVYYLMARGLPRDEAVRLIVAGFMGPAFDRMPDALRAPLRRVVAGKLGVGGDEAAGGGGDDA